MVQMKQSWLKLLADQAEVADLDQANIPDKVNTTIKEPEVETIIKIKVLKALKEMVTDMKVVKAIVGIAKLEAMITDPTEKAEMDPMTNFCATSTELFVLLQEITEVSMNKVVTDKAITHKEAMDKATTHKEVMDKETTHKEAMDKETTHKEVMDNNKATTEMVKVINKLLKPVSSK